jgi:nitric oxide reductase NorQ protein
MTYIGKYDALGPATGAPSFANLVVDVVAQAANAGAATRLGAAVLPQGRYVARASGAERAPRKPRGAAAAAKIVTMLEGETSYARPNGALYHARKWGEHADVEVLRRGREITSKALFGGGEGASAFALLYGAPGCGKTALIEAAFADEVETLMGTGDIEVADLLGGYVQTPGGGFMWIDGGLVRAAENGWVYFIDEIGLIDPKVLSVVYGLMDGRRELTITANPERGTIVAKEGFYVVAATNPNAPGVRLSEALLSRFTLQAEMTTDWNLARKMGVSTTMVTAAQNLAKKQLSGEVSWAPQFRELLAFRDMASVFGQGFAINNLIAAAPEMDRPIVVDVLQRAFGNAELRAARI